MRSRSKKIREAIIHRVFLSRNSPVTSVAREFAITRQAVQLHVRALIKDGLILAEGQRSERRFHLNAVISEDQRLPLAEAGSEDEIWSRFFVPKLAHLTENEKDICHYGITELVNNVFDHSEAATIRVAVRVTQQTIELQIADDGVGIFQKIATALNLTDPRQSLLELSKGKFTTDPSRHTGEGLFFTSRAFDKFYIRSSDLLFVHQMRDDDWLYRSRDKKFQGTRITMGLLLPCTRRMDELFKRYSSGPDDYRFAKTHVPLDLAAFGDETLISRSSAKRVLGRVEKFDEVLLDFAGVRSVGQAFADEIFRVFATVHPNVKLIAINANEQVTGMIRRAQANRAAQAGESAS